MLVNFIDMLKKAKKNNYAVPHFNINNLEWTKFILEKCENLQIPVILGVSANAACYMGGWSVCRSLVESLIKSLNITIPVCLHVDHGTKEDCISAIDAGFTSVMIDASQFDISKNIRITKEVVEYAHSKNVSVEAEVGSLRNNKNIENYASLDECIRLCNETKIDALAPAIGNAHGIYIEKPKLNFDLLQNISNNTDIPLVLHGGSGICEKDIKKLIHFGISKININTDLQIAWKKGLMKYINENKTIYDPRKIMTSTKVYFDDKIEELVTLFETKRVTDL
ncbi:MAG: ketose-bisphosphate aldolase [Bacilli bacterium]|nr:ketose-bisphosphate aldolase [Bacilli bacterium]